MPITQYDEHKGYWQKKLTLPVGDEFWDHHHPGDHWNCKCSLEQTDDPANPEVLDTVPDVPAQRGLENNPGKDGVMFDQSHPYFAKDCKHCFAYRQSGFTNRLKVLFRNRAKDCYNCPYLNGCITRLTSDGFKLEYNFKNGGKLYIHPDIDKDKADYKDMKRICLQIAKMGNEVLMTPRLHCKSEEYNKIYGALIGTKYENKCPDFSVNGVFFEYEGFVKPWTKQKVKRMLSHGMVQSSRIIINNTKGCSDRFIRKMIKARCNVSGIIDEVWIYEKGNVRLFYKEGIFCKNNREA